MRFLLLSGVLALVLAGAADAGAVNHAIASHGDDAGFRYAAAGQPPARGAAGRSGAGQPGAGQLGASQSGAGEAAGGQKVEQGAPQGEGVRPAADDWVAVTSAERLVGRAVTSRDGKQAGEIDELVFDLAHGIAIYALIGSGGDLNIGGDRIVVPFGALRIPATRDHAVALDQDLSRIRKNPRVADDARIEHLASARRLREIHAAYGIAPPPGLAAAPDRGRSSARYVLVRPNRLTRLESPSPLVRDPRGEEVRLAGGEVVGEIDQIVIEVATGRIPYLLVSSGGFLGLGEKWLPVPPMALTWSPLAQTFVLKEANRPEAMRMLNKTDLPATIHRGELEVLYQRFNIPPWWNGGGTAADG